MTQFDYWRTDTEADAVNSLDAAADFLSRVSVRPHYWKWAVLALHSAAQGFLALALRRGDNVLVQKRKVAEGMLAAFSGEGEMPQPHMDNFMRLYRKAQEATHFGSSIAPLTSDPAVDNAIEAFDRLRDDLVHFNSKGWSVSVALLVSRSAACVQMIQSILDSGSILWHEEQLQPEAFANLSKVSEALQGER